MKEFHLISYNTSSISKDKLIISGCNDNTINIWKYNRLEHLFTLKGNKKYEKYEKNIKKI